MAKLEEYRSIVGGEIIDELYLLAQKLKGISIQNINSTSFGGGVAEILGRIVPLLQELGVDVWWDVIKGDENFFAITKRIHNSLHGANIILSRREKDYFLSVNRQNGARFSRWGDIVFIHDPQPVALVEEKARLKNKWIWRCHIDFSAPQPDTWLFLRRFIIHYDSSVFSAPAFARRLKIPQILISPSIDPLSEKNCPLEDSYIDSVLYQYGIDKKRPLITQVSRFDYLKDPLGVIKAYRLVKKYTDCQLVLAGGAAGDDPEGEKILAAVQEEARQDRDIFVLNLPPDSHREINALQRASTLILQKSLREGFGLTVTEALWKKKPVIASCVGGIPLQIAHKYSGILTYTIEGTAYWIKQLLHEPAYAQRLGRNGYAHIKNNFLITRHLQDYLLLFLSLSNTNDTVYL